MPQYECPYCGERAKAFRRGEYTCANCGSTMVEVGKSDSQRVVEHHYHGGRQYEWTHLWFALIFVGVLMLLYIPGILNFLAYAFIATGLIALLIAWKWLIFSLIIGSAGVVVSQFLPEYYWHGVMLALVGLMLILVGGIKGEKR